MKKQAYREPRYVDGPRDVTCAFCGQSYTTERIFGSHKDCMRRRQSMTWEHFLMALANLKQVIEDGDVEEHWNSSAVGDKDSACSWGLCTKNPNVYPLSDMHIWPYENEMTGRFAPNYRAAGMHCPMRYDWERQAHGDPQWKATPGGCFYDCRFFSPNGSVPTRKVAISLIEARIKLVTLWVKKGVVSDEQET